MLASGEQHSRKMRVQNQSPLMYEWYQELYVGAAHGLAGIYYYLMQVCSTSSTRLWLNRPEPDLLSSPLSPAWWAPRSSCTGW